MGGSTGPKRTVEQRKSDALEFYMLNLSGMTTRQISEYVKENRDYELSHTIVSDDIKSVDLNQIPNLLDMSQDRMDSVLFFRAVATKCLRSGGFSGDSALLRIAVDSRWKAHQIIQQDNERFAKLFEGIDIGKITPDWRNRLEVLVNEIKK